MLNSTAKIEVGSECWVLDVVCVCMVPDMVVVFLEICHERFVLVYIYIYMTIYVVNNINKNVDIKFSAHDAFLE